MKNLFKITLVFVMLIMVSCKTKNQPINSGFNKIVDTADVVYVDTLNQENKKEIETVKSVNIDSLLQTNIDVASRIAFEDSLYYALGNRAFYGDNITGQIVAFVKFEKDANVIAIVSPKSYDDETQPLVKFYELKNRNWELIQEFETNEISYFEEVDLNNNRDKEIQAIGYPNMNGNYWNNFFSYSKSENQFIEGGGFFSSLYEIKPESSRVEVDYEGSWYMPNTKTIYYWKNHKLIPYKGVEVGLKIADMRHEARYIKYSENLNLDKDSLQLIYKKTYRGKKMHDFFDNFFENN